MNTSAKPKSAWRAKPCWTNPKNFPESKPARPARFQPWNACVDCGDTADVYMVTDAAWAAAGLH
jgi:hypothetical protein